MIRDIKKLLNKTNALPASLTFFVTNKCNLSCKHCFYWDHLNQGNDILSLDEIDRFSKSLGQITNINIGGGEPFLRRDFSQVVNTLVKNLSPLKMVIVSNGSLPEMILKSAVEILEQAKDTHFTFHFSIDDIGTEFEEFRGMRGLTEKIQKTITGMKELKERYKNFNVGIAMTVNPVNQARVLDIYRYLRDEIRPDVISPILMRSSSDKLNSKDVDIRNYEMLTQMIKADTKKKIIPGHHKFKGSKIAQSIHFYKHQVIAETVKENKYLMPCYAGILSGVIYENGDVCSCEILNWKMGNLRDFGFDFKSLWRSAEAESVRGRIAEKKCFCTYECAVDVNIAYNPKNLLRSLVAK